MAFYDECRVGDRVYVYDWRARPQAGEITRLAADETAGSGSLVYVRFDAAVRRFGERAKSVAVEPRRIFFEKGEK